MRIKYSNDDIKKKYKSIVAKHTMVNSIIRVLKRIIKLVPTDDDDIRIVNVVSEAYGSLITVSFEDSMININVDYLNKKINIISSLLPYKIIYDDCPKKNFVPSGYEYESEKRNIFYKFLVRFNSSYNNTILFTVTEKHINSKYTVLLDFEDNYIDIGVFNNNLLNYDKDITNIKDLLIFIASLINLKKCKIKITDTSDNIIIVNNNNLVNYIEYREFNNEKQKIFLKNNELYIEKKVIEECDEIEISFIKKLGVNNGKEQRKD